MKVLKFLSIQSLSKEKKASKYFFYLKFFQKCNEVVMKQVFYRKIEGTKVRRDRILVLLHYVWTKATASIRSI